VKGEVIVQAFCPENPTLSFALGHDYSGFAAQERAAREEAVYPPFCHIAEIEVSGAKLDRVDQATALLARELRKDAPQLLGVLGPAEAFVPFVNGKHIYNLLVKSVKMPPLRAALVAALAKAEVRAALRGLKVKVDVDV
jgi:primosomal protein N' (replication factor Y)